MKPWPLLLLIGCTATDEVDREYEDAINAEKWEACKQIYAKYSIPTVSYHEHRRGRPHRPYEVEEDLRVNSCNLLLGDIYD